MFMIVLKSRTENIFVTKERALLAGFGEVIIDI